MRPRRTIAKLVALFTRGRGSAELDVEIRAHIEFEERENLASGMAPQDARDAARRAFGNVTLAKEDSRNMWNFLWLESVLQDLRFALRMMRKNPGFTCIAVLTLALGIGANTAIFSVINTVLLRPLPFKDSSRLVSLYSYSDREKANLWGARASISPNQYFQIKSANSLFEGAAAFQESYHVLTGSGEPETVYVAHVQGDFFSALGIPALRGRVLLSGEKASGRDHIAVMSYRLWRRQFGGDANAIGATIRLDNEPYEIVGILPSGMELPQSADLWTPFDIDKLLGAKATVHTLSAVARIREGVSLVQAQAALDTIAARVVAAYGKDINGWNGLVALPLKQGRVHYWQSSLLLLFGAVGFVLLIACTNVANLILARSWGRQKEFAIRAALGASRGRVLRQSLVESALTALVGGLLGFLLAFWSLGAIRSIAPPDIPRLGELSVDSSVFFFMLGVSAVAGILFGLAPGVQAGRQDLNADLKGAATAGRAVTFHKRLHVWDFFSACETALCMVLLIGAVLVIRSFLNLTSVDVGFRTDHVLSLMMDIPFFEYHTFANERIRVQQILDRVRALPGVQAAFAKIDPVLGGADFGDAFQVEGQAGADSRQESQVRYATSGYFQTFGIPVLQGRGFTPQEGEARSAVALVNQAFAERYFAGRNPLGQHLIQDRGPYGGRTLLEIVGEVPTVRDKDLSIAPQPTVYIPLFEAPFGYVEPLYLGVRTTTDPLASAGAIEQQIWSTDKNIPVREVETQDQVVSDLLIEPRFRTVLLGTFAGLGLILALIGVYGVVSYSVGRRMREIGIRMALGAQRGDVLRLVLSEGMTPVAAGVVIGSLGALALTRLIQNYLFGIRPNDPSTFAMAAAAFAIVAALACYIPARRAARVDPMTTLRDE